MDKNATMRWKPTIAPPSLAGPHTHPAYFKQLEEAPPAAVVVFHGIGEEVRFETLSRAASLLLVEAQQRGAKDISVVIRPVPKDADATSLEVRAELGWTERDGTKRHVHVYESYWAPLTVGKVTYWETVCFLATAGWNGLRGTLLSGRGRTFNRWLFGEFKTLQVTAGTAPMLVVLMILVGFIAAVIAMAADAVAGIAKQVGTGGVQQQAANVATFIYDQIALPWNWFALHAGLVAGRLQGVRAVPDWVQHFLFSAGVSGAHWVQAAVAFSAWIGLVFMAFWFKGILTQYAGSLVAYLSPYKDSKWEQLRRDIQQRGLDLAGLVYEGYKLPSGWIPKYDRIVILGHSLGSVIAYDTLNAMINIEAARLPAGTPNPAVERTKGLITFGSPLDKTAFLFRVQLKTGGGRLDDEGELRETMVSAVQPLIADYAQYRYNHTPPPQRPKWINLWSRMDIISGHLDYYDDPAIPKADPRHVQNLVDPGATIPIAAHNQYWTTKLLRSTLYNELF
ncbi:MAG TPA: hypothetical protein VHZ28_12400 [Terracidiphilus sp.]|jgi:hypothetical protein|nr:hypothetical protein [Terracidiphilus sp.]